MNLWPLRRHRCPRCGARAAADAVLCSRCGAALRPAVHANVCPSCDARISASAAVCPICGYVLKHRSPQQRRQRIRLAFGAIVILCLLAGAWVWGRARLADGLDEVASLVAPEPSATVQATRAQTASPTTTPSATSTRKPTPTATATHTFTAQPTATQTLTVTPETISYVVVSGDSVELIAKKMGVDIALLLRANGITTESILRIGQELIVPGSSGGPDPEAEVVVEETATPEPTMTPEPTVGDVVHVVKSGDILGAIAVQYDVSIEDIVSANEMNEHSVLQVGQELVIPGRVPTGTATPEPSVTATATPSSTPTVHLVLAPAQPYPAVALLCPVDQERIAGDSDSVVLSWASVGVLADDEWYRLSVWPSAGEGAQVQYVKATSWRFTPSSEVTAKAWGWQVDVVRRDVADQVSTVLAPPGRRRLFAWP